ncbi:trigger factor [Aphanothece sacrum]|uniref:Trigger factor n=1 Tax=Aphanothece sacrum FPU1 TaxID=1920663 RepID=A0A401IC99_APHSA|nr:trigger factor [Aphanothece sacrum]GBF78850.1 trigger factor [Aphanothece sacrum FPU1]GBF83082.1 trigger factor [Aphanothece sacrum FPU3]
MKVTQEKLPDSQIGLKIEIPAETLKKAYEKTVNNLARTANIPGFRKGKVPRQILLQRLGKQYIKAATLEELIQETVKNVIKEESLEVLGNNYLLRSSFEELIGKFNTEEPLTFLAAVDVPPTVELGDYHTLSIKAEETVYNPQKLEDWLKERQEKQATLVPVEDRPLQMGDVAIVDYEGRFAPAEGEELSSEPIPGVHGKDFRVDLEEGRFIAGMVEGMVGMNPEEIKDISLVFPDEYPQEDLAGQPVVFRITLKEIKEKELPELDDDFAEEVSKYETIAELRESLEKEFQEEAANATKKSTQDAIIAQLMELCTADIPDTMIQDQITQVLTQTAMQMEQMGIDLRQLFTQENLPKLRENARPEAFARLKQTLVIKEIAKVENIKIGESAIQERSQTVIEQLSGQQVDADKLRQLVYDDLLAEATLDWLQDKATVELVPEGTLKAAETEETEETEETQTIDVSASDSEE